MCQFLLISFDWLLPYLLFFLFRLSWPAIIILIAYSVIRGNNKAKQFTKQWAEKNGWQLVEFSWQWRKSPFEGPRRRGESYYQFAVVDKKGQLRRGWVRYYAAPFRNWDQEIKWVENADG